MPTGYSILEYTGDGSTDTFSINFTLGYLSLEHIKCRVADEVDGSGNPAYRTLYPVAGNPGVIRVGGTVPAVGEKVVFTRTVPKDTLTNDYADGAILTGDNLDNSMKQAMMAVHEALDGRNLDTVYTDIDMTGHKLLNVFTDPSDPDSIATVAYVGDAPAQAAAAAASAAAAQTSQVAAAASEVAAEAAQAVCEDKAAEATASADRAEGALDGNTNVMLGLAMKLAVLTDTNARDFLLNSWTDPIVSADFVTATGAEFVDADGGYLTNAGADNVVTAFDLTAAQFLDEKGSITTFTVDTADTSGHFNAAKSTRVVAGCRIVIAGTSYPIVSISGDGTANNSVVFSGTLTTGAKAVSGIYGCALDGTALRLSKAQTTPSYSHALSSGDRTASITVATNFTPQMGTPDAWVDGATGNNTTDSWSFPTESALNKTVTFTFPYPVILTEATLYQDKTTEHGTWKWQGYNGASWSDIGGTFTLGGATTQVLTSLNANATAYTQYRLIGTAGTMSQSPYLQEITFKVGTVVHPVAVYPLSLSTDCTDWTALKALARTETLGGQYIWYALSFDGGTTYSAFVSSAWLSIVRNNSGTWEYWTGSAWDASSVNSALGAMVQATSVVGNRMTGAAMAGLSQAQIEGSGGFTGGQTSLPVLAALYSGSTTATPVLSAMSMTSDIQAHDCTITFDEFQVTDPDMVKAVLVMQAVDAVTLNTDLKAWVKRGTGEYMQATLAPDSYIDGSTPILVGNVDLSAGTGDACTFKITSHNHKELRIKSAANYVRSV